MEHITLIELAKSAILKSYSPYSDFKVGAALLAKSGKVYTGANIENASYGVTCCAERTALFEAVKSGEREFVSICVVGGKSGNIHDYCPPCGVCRQALAEFCSDDFKIILWNGTETKCIEFKKLFPFGFTGETL